MALHRRVPFSGLVSLASWSVPLANAHADFIHDPKAAQQGFHREERYESRHHRNDGRAALVVQPQDNDARVILRRKR